MYMHCIDKMQMPYFIYIFNYYFHLKTPKKNFKVYMYNGRTYREITDRARVPFHLRFLKRFDCIPKRKLKNSKLHCNKNYQKLQRKVYDRSLSEAFFQVCSQNETKNLQLDIVF